jgi:PKHD-type hydroxylase
MMRSFSSGPAGTLSQGEKDIHMELPMLLHIPDVLSHEQVAQMRAALEAADWTDGRETVGVQGARVKRNQQLPDASPLRQQLGQLVLSALAKHPVYHAATLPLRTLPPRFNRYAGGGHYGMHVDGAVMALPADMGQLRSDVSCTLFLSEPDDYDGGELIVSDTYGEHEVKLPAGDLIVYPSSSLHRVAAVTRGTRMASFFWVQSLIRDDSRRHLLFELDTSIQKLTQTGAAADALLQLTGIYHNLLRQWAET